LDDDNGSNSGSAYVFRWHSGTPGSWIQEQKLLSSDGAAGDSLGLSVAISGDVAVVGAYLDDDNGTDSGSAYVFRWNPGVPGSWAQEQKLMPLDGAHGDQFGISVSVSDDVVVVGANRDDDNGSAYIFRWNGTVWNQEQRLLASNGAPLDDFGKSVTVFGNVTVVGASEDDDNGTRSGSAFIFQWNGNSWVQHQKLLPTDGAAADGFGVSVSIFGDVVAVGAPFDDDNGNGAGSAYFYRWNGSTWQQGEKLLASDGAPVDYFGSSLSVSSEGAVVGAFLDSNKNGLRAGSAYVFNILRCDPGYYGPMCLECPWGANNPCNGQAECDDGVGGSGACICEDDGVVCTADTFDYSDGTCVSIPDDERCADGIGCNGHELCDTQLGCGPGVPTNCDDGLFCNGMEACAECPEVDSCCFPSGVCIPEVLRSKCIQFGGTPGCSEYICLQGNSPCDDGIACTVDCDEANDACTSTPDHSFCDDGEFCNGRETCSTQLGCVPGAPPTCDDGLFCTGVDTCDASSPITPYCCFQPGLCFQNHPTSDCIDKGGTPCTTGDFPCGDGVGCTIDTCDEDSDACVFTPNHPACDNGLFCDGAEVCDPAAGCIPGLVADCDDGIMCTIDVCNEANDSCTSTADDSACDDGLYCNDVETCNPFSGCEPGTPVDCDDGIGCTIDTCDESSDACSNTYDASICGVCCATAGVCVDGRTAEECATISGTFAQGAVCQGVTACCLSDESCIDTDVTCCQAQGGISDSAGFLCNDEDFFGCAATIPTVSEWGLVVLTLLTLTGAKLAFRPRTT